MDEKYLDGDGLTLVWNKIKDGFLSIKVISQNDYNKLSDEEKKKRILYDVTNN